MPTLRALPLLWLPLLAACGYAPQLRVLSSDVGGAPRAEPEATPAVQTPAPQRDAVMKPRTRIGAPGGSGAGARSVLPRQSGKETVGGLPAGIGAGRRG